MHSDRLFFFNIRGAFWPPPRDMHATIKCVCVCGLFFVCCRVFILPPMIERIYCSLRWVWFDNVMMSLETADWLIFDLWLCDHVADKYSNSHTHTHICCHLMMTFLVECFRIHKFDMFLFSSPECGCAFRTSIYGLHWFRLFKMHVTYLLIHLFWMTRRATQATISINTTDAARNENSRTNCRIYWVARKWHRYNPCLSLALSSTPCTNVQIVHTYKLHATPHTVRCIVSKSIMHFF